MHLIAMTAALVMSGAEPPTLDEGWRWVYGPQTLHESWIDHGYTRITEVGVVSMDATDDSIVVRHVRPSTPGVVGTAETSYEIVIESKDGERIKSNGWGQSANETYVSRRMQYDIAPDEVATIGLAILDLEGKRGRAASAAERAEGTGATALPLPVVGEPLVFDLPAFDGSRIRSEDLKGKVVLIDHWATWCGPCMEKMPELRETYAEFKDDGFVVIGVNFDVDPVPAKKAIKDGEMIWLNVHAESAAAGYDGDLWHDMTGIVNIPRLLLIDRDGVLQADFYPHNLKERVEALVKPVGDG